MKVPHFLLLPGLAGTICSTFSLGTNTIPLPWLSLAIDTGFGIRQTFGLFSPLLLYNITEINL